MIANYTFNSQRGKYFWDFAEFLGNVSLQMNNYEFIIKSQQGLPVLKMFCENNQFKICGYDDNTQTWQEAFQLTPNLSYEVLDHKNKPNGYAGLDPLGMLTSNLIPNKYVTVIQDLRQNITQQRTLQIGTIFIATDQRLVFILVNPDTTQISSWLCIFGNSHHNPQNPSNKNTVYAYLNSNQQVNQSQFPVRFDDIMYIDDCILPRSISMSVSCQHFTLLPGTYRFDIKLVVQYQKSTQNPAEFALYSSLLGILQNTRTTCLQTQSFQVPTTTQTFFVVRIIQTQNIQVILISDPQYIQFLNSGTSVYIQQLSTKFEEPQTPNQNPYPVLQGILI